MKKKFSKELGIGLSVIVGIVILVVGINYLKGINLFSSFNFYEVNYDNVAGLEVSAPVTIDGYKVGQVREIEFNYEKPGKIKVLLALNKELRIPEDSYATIESTLLSGGFINMHLGNSRKMLEKGDEIKPASKPDLMSSLTDDILPNVSLIVPKIDALLVNLNKLVTDPSIYASLHRLDGITGDVYDITGGLKTNLNSSVPVLMSDITHASGRLDSITLNLAQLSYQLKTLPLKPTMENIEDVAEQLNQFSRQLNDPNSTLGLLTTDPELYNRLSRVSADVDSLILDIKKNPKRYINIKLL